MRSQIHKSLDAKRLQFPGYESPAGANWGAFGFRHHGEEIRIISSGDKIPDGWEHVSVSLKDRCPTWNEMCYVKSLFWSDSETVLEFHPKKSKYKNIHEFCLHLWKRQGVDHELPPDICV